MSKPSFKAYDKKFDAWLTKVRAILGWKSTPLQMVLQDVETSDPFGCFDEGWSAEKFAWLVKVTDYLELNEKELEEYGVWDCFEKGMLWQEFVALVDKKLHPHAQGYPDSAAYYAAQRRGGQK